MELKALLQEMIDKKASDVFIVAGLPLTKLPSTKVSIVP